MRNRVRRKAGLRLGQTLPDALCIPVRKLIAAARAALVRVQMTPRQERSAVRTAQFPLPVVYGQ